MLFSRSPTVAGLSSRKPNLQREGSSIDMMYAQRSFSVLGAFDRRFPGPSSLLVPYVGGAHSLTVGARSSQRDPIFDCTRTGTVIFHRLRLRV